MDFRYLVARVKAAAAAVFPLGISARLTLSLAAVALLAAAELAGSGQVRLNGQRIDAASRAVRAGDVVTIALDRTVRVLKVVAFAERRGPAEAGRALYDDLAPPPPRASAPTPEAAPAALRDPGAGRPTKRDRRALDRNLPGQRQRRGGLLHDVPRRHRRQRSPPDGRPLDAGVLPAPGRRGRRRDQHRA